MNPGSSLLLWEGIVFLNGFVFLCTDVLFSM